MTPDETFKLLQGPVFPIEELPFILQQVVAEFRSTANYLTLEGKITGIFYDNRCCRELCERVDDAIIESRSGEIRNPVVLISDIIDMRYMQAEAACSLRSEVTKPSTRRESEPNSNAAIAFSTGIALGLWL